MPRSRAFCHQSPRHIEHLGLVQGFSDPGAVGRQERVGDAAANDQLINLSTAATRAR